MNLLVTDLNTVVRQVDHNTMKFPGQICKKKKERNESELGLKQEEKKTRKKEREKHGLNILIC